MKITEAQQRTIDNRNNWGTISKNIQKDIERIEDIRKDLDRIDKYYNKERAAEIKKEMCAVITNSI